MLVIWAIYGWMMYKGTEKYEPWDKVVWAGLPVCLILIVIIAFSARASERRNIERGDNNERLGRIKPKSK